MRLTRQKFSKKERGRVKKRTEIITLWSETSERKMVRGGTFYKRNRLIHKQIFKALIDNFVKFGDTLRGDGPLEVPKTIKCWADMDSITVG